MCVYIYIYTYTYCGGCPPREGGISSGTSPCWMATASPAMARSWPTSMASAAQVKVIWPE